MQSFKIPLTFLMGIAKTSIINPGRCQAVGRLWRVPFFIIHGKEYQDIFASCDVMQWRHLLNCVVHPMPSHYGGTRAACGSVSWGAEYWVTSANIWQRCVTINRTKECLMGQHSLLPVLEWPPSFTSHKMMTKNGRSQNIFQERGGGQLAAAGSPFDRP